MSERRWMDRCAVWGVDGTPQRGHRTDLPRFTCIEETEIVIVESKATMYRDLVANAIELWGGSSCRDRTAASHLRVDTFGEGDAFDLVERGEHGPLHCDGGVSTVFSAHLLETHREKR
jgi:hypothetical protein